MNGENVIADSLLIDKIFVIRGQKVMLDSDLAELYEVETKALKQAVKRNSGSFPTHFMFKLTEAEFAVLRSQFVTSNTRGGSRYLPLVFTEYGVLQLSNVLRSARATQMGIRIIEVFVKLQKMIADNFELQSRVDKLERNTDNNTKNIEIVFKYFDELIEKTEKPRKKIGYVIKRKE